MFQAYVQRASIGSVRIVVFDDPLTPNPQQHLYTRCYCVSCRLLQYGAGWVASVYYRQASACAECCSASHHWHAEVWPRLVLSASQFTPSYIGWTSVHVFSINIVFIVIIYRCLQNRAPQYLMDCCVWRFQSSAPAVSQSASPGRGTTSSQQVRTPIVLRCSSDGLELVSGLSSGPNAEHRQLQISTKDSYVRGATGHVAH